MHSDPGETANLVELRHALHRRPELGGCEKQTMRRIREELAALPLEVMPPLIGTDTVAILRGGKPGKCVALRADIDALPIREESGETFSSETPGVMHACGHDVHSTILLGAALALARRRDLSGTVLFIWQPGEEKYAMGKILVEAGVLEDPAPDFVVWRVQRKRQRRLGVQVKNPTVPCSLAMLI